jgi:ribonuclease HI
VDDLTLAKPLDLLARYRLLCERMGACRATDTALPRELRDQLSRIEGELQTRLWLATAGGSGSPDPEKPARSPRSTTSPAAPPTGRTAPSNGTDPTGAAAARRVKGIHLDGPELAPLAPSRTATVYCDGACLGNPGPGGYGVLVRVPGQPERTLSAGKARTTNNEMELTGAVEGLKLAVSLGAKEINVVSDSEYLVKGMSGWLKGWLRNGWKTAAGTPVKNRALWEELHRLCQGRTVNWSWIRGHIGHAENERCDALAVAAAREAGRRG